jgi:hypothetical protein
VSAPEVNVPLLRKAVEWAEAEAAKPWELCEWYQGDWVTPASSFHTVPKAPECGTCYCIAGFVASQTLRAGERLEGEHVVMADGSSVSVADRAESELGADVMVSDYGDLFSGSNTIEDVRRIAEEIAGERL